MTRLVLYVQNVKVCSLAAASWSLIVYIVTIATANVVAKYFLTNNR